MKNKIINTYVKSPFSIFTLSCYHFSLCDIVIGTTILTIHGPMPVEKINVNDYVIGYENNRLITNQVIQISTTKTDTLFSITTNDKVIHATKNQLFYDPCIKQWVKAKNLTTNNTFLNSNLEYCSCQSITIYSQPTTIYKISTTSPHNFFISEAQILTHNFPPIVMGLACAFGEGIKFAGITLGALFGGTAIGVNLLNKHKKKDDHFELKTETTPYSGNYNPDPEDDDKNKKERRNNARENYKPLTNKEARKLAKYMGYKETKKSSLWKYSK